MTMLENVKRTARRNVRKMSDDEILQWLERRAAGFSVRSDIDTSQMCRDLTGGYWSQSLDAYVRHLIATRYQQIKQSRRTK